MKLIYQGLLDVFGEAEEEISKEGQTYCMSYVIQAVNHLYIYMYITAFGAGAKNGFLACTYYY